MLKVNIMLLILNTENNVISVFNVYKINSKNKEKTYLASLLWHLVPSIFSSIAFLRDVSS